MPFLFVLFQQPPFLSIEIDIYSAKALLKMLIPSGICHVFGVVLCHLKPFSTLRNHLVKTFKYELFVGFDGKNYLCIEITNK